jgi:hypothetical protein
MKLGSLPDRLKIPLYTTLAERLHELEFIPSERSIGGYPYEASPVSMTLSSEASEILLGRYQKVFENYFTIEELIDLSVFILSHLSFFPEDDEGWQKLKSQIVTYDIWVALALAFGLAWFDEGSLGAHGWLHVKEGSDFRLGWYASIRKLGFTWRPELKAGLRVMRNTFDLRAEWIENLNPFGDRSQRSANLIFREHPLAGFTGQARVDFSILARLNWIINHPDESKNGTFRTEFESYARRFGVFGFPNLAVVGSTRFKSDFKNSHEGGVSLGIKNQYIDLHSSIDLSIPTEKESSRRNLRAGVIFGGNLSSPEKLETDKLWQTNSLITEQLEYLTRLKGQADEASQSLLFFGTGRLSPAEERKNLQDLKHLYDWMHRGQMDLLRYYQDYRVTQSWLQRRTMRSQSLLSKEDEALTQKWLSYSFLL